MAVGDGDGRSRGGRFQSTRTRATCCALVVLLCACASKPNVKVDGNQVVGVALVESGPTVSFPTPAGAAARVGATAALAPLVSLLGVFAYRPDAVVGAAKAVSQESGRSACVTSIHEGHPDLTGEISRTIERDFSTKTVFDRVVAYLAARTSLEVMAVANDSGTLDLTHEAALRQAKRAGIDVLFELSHMEVDFDVDNTSKDCAMRLQARLKYRIIRVDRDQELERGQAFAKGPSAEETASRTITHWLDDRGTLAKTIDATYGDAIPRIWYVGLPVR